MSKSIHSRSGRGAGARRAATGDARCAFVLAIYAITTFAALVSAFVGTADEMRSVLLVVFPAETALVAAILARPD